MISTHISGAPFGESYTASKCRISVFKIRSARKPIDSRSIATIAPLFSNDSSNAVWTSNGTLSVHAESAK